MRLSVETKNLMAEIHGLDGASHLSGPMPVPSEYTQYALNEDPCTAMTLRMITCIIWDLPWSRTLQSNGQGRWWDCCIDDFQVASRTR